MVVQALQVERVEAKNTNIFFRGQTFQVIGWKAVGSAEVQFSCFDEVAELGEIEVTPDDSFVIGGLLVVRIWFHWHRWI